jgi:hypothetical protein
VDQDESAQGVERQDVAVVEQEPVRGAHQKEEREAAPVHRLRRRDRAGRGRRRASRGGCADRAKLQRRPDPEQEREDRDELGRDERADQQVDRGVGDRRHGQELAERVAAAPDERLDVDLEDAAQRKRAQRIDELDARVARGDATQSALRPSARSSS